MRIFEAYDTIKKFDTPKRLKRAARGFIGLSSRAPASIELKDDYIEITYENTFYCYSDGTRGSVKKVEIG